MAIDITPLRELVREATSYQTYTGNHSLTPADYDHGCAVFTLVGSTPVSTPSSFYSHEVDTGKAVRVRVSYHSYLYHLDLARTAHPAVPAGEVPRFEHEVFAVVDMVNARGQWLARQHGLGVSRMHTRFSYEQGHGKMLHRCVCDFTVMAQSQVMITSEEGAVECVDVSSVVMGSDGVLVYNGWLRLVNPNWLLSATPPPPPQEELPAPSPASSE